jgi:hypothetical protein
MSFEDAETNYCPTCGELWINHNDDGSCVSDDPIEDEPIYDEFEDGIVN